MTMFKITAIASGLILGASSLAFAQTDSATTAGQTGTATVQQHTQTQTGQAGALRHMTQDQIRSRLEAAGYQDIEIESEGALYTGTAQRYGEEVDLQVTASTGRVIQPDRLTSDQIRYRLEDEGYENIGDLEENDNYYTTTAERFGEEIDLQVSARTGGVMDPRDLSRDQIVTMLEEDDYSEVVVFERDQDYGNFYVKAEKDDEVFLLEVNPISGRIMNEREQSS